MRVNISNFRLVSNSREIFSPSRKVIHFEEVFMLLQTSPDVAFIYMQIRPFRQTRSNWHKVNGLFDVAL